jgi:hypothetical protein
MHEHTIAPKALEGVERLVKVFESTHQAEAGERENRCCHESHRDSTTIY